MIDLDRDFLEAQAILAGTSALLPTFAHLLAMQAHHEDQMIVVAMLIAKLHDQVLEMD